MAGFQFIVTDNRGQTRRDDRRTIRSQCMKGKNKKHKPHDASDSALGGVDLEAVAGAQIQAPENPAIAPQPKPKSRCKPKLRARTGRRRVVSRKISPIPASAALSTSSVSASASTSASASASVTQPSHSSPSSVIFYASSPSRSRAFSPRSFSPRRSPSRSFLSRGSFSRNLPYRYSPFNGLPPVNATSPTDTDSSAGSDTALAIRTRTALSPSSPTSLTDREYTAYWAHSPQLEAAVIAAVSAQAPKGALGQDVQLAQFADMLDAAGHETIHTFFSVAHQIVYPASIFVDFSPSNNVWFSWLFEDAAYLHASLALMIGVRNVLNGRPHGRNVVTHVTKSLRALHARIAHDSATGDSLSTSNSSVAVVLSLIVVADMLQDDQSAKSHFDGLRRMVSLRGGLDDFLENAKMHIKISRFDLNFALDHGSRSQFTSNPVSFASMTPRPLLPSSPLIFNPSPLFPTSDRPPSASIGITDGRLTTVFEDMFLLSTRVNLVHDSLAPKLTDGEFQQYLSSVQYRLLQLDSNTLCTHDECLRLCLLAVLATTYPLPNTRLRYPYLARNLRITLDAILPVSASPEAMAAELRADVDRRELLLWALLIGALAVFDVDGRTWMHALWRSLEPPREWDRMRFILERFVWFRPLHDDVGRKCFDGLWAASDALDSFSYTYQYYDDIRPSIETDGYEVVG
ncbi:hypothetical protein HOO65_060656 [Ceratocystis lukuohia]|uniref:Fungal specific transcription factor domain protein n=1 Tax=Ceratocystis lukuohia TaxID=2019550 RepID=A0ABR4MEX0_9PEZI